MQAHFTPVQNGPGDHPVVHDHLDPTSNGHDNGNAQEVRHPLHEGIHEFAFLHVVNPHDQNRHEEEQHRDFVKVPGSQWCHVVPQEVAKERNPRQPFGKAIKECPVTVQVGSWNQTKNHDDKGQTEEPDNSLLPTSHLVIIISPSLDGKPFLILGPLVVNQ